MPQKQKPGARRGRVFHACVHAQAKLANRLMLYFRKHFSSVIKFKAAIRLRRGSAVSVFDPVPFKPAIKVCHPEIEIADAMRNLLQSKSFASIVLNGELFIDLHGHLLKKTRAAPIHPVIETPILALAQYSVQSLAT